MYISFRSSKLLFTIGTVWGNNFFKNTVKMSTYESVGAIKRMFTYRSYIMGFVYRRYCYVSPEYVPMTIFYQSYKLKAYSSYGVKSTEQWLSQEIYILLTVTDNTLLLLCPSSLAFLIITDHYSIPYFVFVTRTILK